MVMNTAHLLGGVLLSLLRDGLKKSFLEKYSPATMRVTGRRFR